MSLLMRMRSLRPLARGNFMKKLLPHAMYLLVIALIASGLACQQKIQLADYKKYENDAAVPRMWTEDAKKDVDAGIAVIVDSRPEFAYKHEHIAGSVNIPYGAPDDAFGVLPKGKKIIV